MEDLVLRGLLDRIATALEHIDHKLTDVVIGLAEIKAEVAGVARQTRPGR